MISVPWLSECEARIDRLEARLSRLEVVLASAVGGVEVLMGLYNRLWERVEPQSAAPRPHPPEDLPALDFFEDMRR